MDERNKLLQLIIDEKGGTLEDYQYIMDRIVYQESKGDYTIHQRANSDGTQGPGKGGFQFESGWAYEEDEDGNKVVKSARGAGIAANRLENFYKERGVEVPQWLKDFKDVEEGDESAFDASKLTKEQQEQLFLGDAMGKPGADFSELINGDISLKEYWRKYHWAGSDDVAEQRYKQWDEIEEDIQKKPEKFQNLQSRFQAPVQEPEAKREDVKPVDSTIASAGKTSQDLTGLLKGASNSDKRYNSKRVTSEPKLENPFAQYSEFSNRLFTPDKKEFNKTEYQPRESDMNLKNIDERLIEKEIPPSKFEGVDPNLFKLGGKTSGVFSNMSKFDNADKNYNKFNTGDTHEASPHGGIPLGSDSEGTPNLVEKDEVSYKLKRGDFIFSNRIRTDGQIEKQAGFSLNEYAYGGLKKNFYPTKRKL